MKKFALTSLCAIASASTLSAASISIVADNDFAILGGNASGITSVKYNNNVLWNNQSTAPLSIDLSAGEDRFFILLMGGGGPEDIAGTIDGVNIVTTHTVQSSDVSGYLTGYNPTDVESGVYTVTLADAQNAATNATWAASSIVNTGVSLNAVGLPTGIGTSSNTAVLLSVAPVTAVPEPSSTALLGLAGLGLAFRRSRK